MLFDSNYDILEKAKIMVTVKGSMVARGWGKEGWLGKAERIARAVKLLRVILQWCMHVTEHRISPASPNINYGLWVVLMYQCWPTDCNNVPSGGGCW